MAASGPALLQGLLSCSHFRFLTQSDRQPWGKVLIAASALTLGSVTLSKACALAERKTVLGKISTEGVVDSKRPFSSFASLALAPVEDMEEPKSGTVFARASPDGRKLTGVGLRSRKIMGLKNITIYAYGLYADPDSLKSALSTKYQSFTPAELSNKDKLCNNVTETDVGMTVQLVIVFGKLKIGNIRSAFEESVGNGIKKFSGSDNKELLGRFTSIFTDDLKLPKGTTIDLSRTPGQVLQIKLDGREIGSVQSALLCRALFDLYIGDDPFDKPAKEAMGSGIASLLSG